MKRKICKLDKYHKDYYYWNEIKIPELNIKTWSKVFPNYNKELHKKVFKKFRSLNREG
tara:strand:+ start:383 stop:556 length:174 start_codon:yes stop_codon:yes gene_type:complete